MAADGYVGPDGIVQAEKGKGRKSVAAKGKGEHERLPLVRLSRPPRRALPLTAPAHSLLALLRSR